MKMYNKIYQYSELKRFQERLKSVYKRNMYFRKLHETKKKEEDKTIIISNGNDKNIFSDIPNDVIDYLRKKGNLDIEIFNLDKKEITVRNFQDILDTIDFLLNIIEFDLMKNCIVD